MPVGGDIDRDQIVPIFRLVRATRGERAPKNAGIADQHIEALVAFVESQCESRDAVAVLHVERHQGGGAAGGLDLVVELFQPADRARDGHDMRAGLRKLERDRSANAARGAGDQRNTVGEGLGHAPVDWSGHGRD